MKHMSTTTLINPANEQVLRTVELLDVAAVDDAVARAKSAQRAWARRRADLAELGDVADELTDVDRRADELNRRAAALLDEHLDTAL